MPSSRRGAYGIAKYVQDDEIAMRELQKKGQRALNAPDKNGRTSLMKAAIYGSHQTIGRLLRAGAEINGRGYHGNTALHALVWKVEMKRATWVDYRLEDSQWLIDHFGGFLLAAGADPTLRGQGDRTPAEYAVYLGMDEEAAILKAIEQEWRLRRRREASGAPTARRAQGL